MKFSALVIAVALIACGGDDGSPFDQPDAGGEGDALVMQTEPDAGTSDTMIDPGTGGTDAVGGAGGSVEMTGGTAGMVMGGAGGGGIGGLGGIGGVGGAGGMQMTGGMGGSAPPPACEVKPEKAFAYLGCSAPSNGGAYRTLGRNGPTCSKCANLVVTGCLKDGTQQSHPTMYCVQSECTECCVQKDYACASQADCCDGLVCAQGKCRG